MTWGLLCKREKNTLTRCHSCSVRLTQWCLAFYLVPNVNLRVRMISVYLAKERATIIKIKIDPSVTQRIRATLACPKTPIVETAGCHRAHPVL